jgi:hypothetical protein
MALPAIFVHDPGESWLTGPGTVVALSANAFEGCLRLGLTPSVLDDLAERPDVCRSPDAYQRWQLSWLDRLDTACGLGGVARSCAQLIVPSLDTLVMNAAMLRSVVDAQAPESIAYVGKVGPVETTGYHNGHLQFWPILGDVPLAARLLPLIAAQRSLPFTAQPVQESASAKAVGISLRNRVRRRLSRAVGPYRRSYRRPLRGRTRPSTTLMMWYAGYGAGQFATDEHRAGRDTVFITRGDSSFRIIDPALPPNRAPSRRIDMTVNAAGTLDPRLLALLEEVDVWTGVPGASRVLESRLAVFLHGMCVAAGLGARRIRPELTRFGIDRLAAANPSSLEEFACLIAARSAGIERVLVQHGDHLLPYGSWLVSETGDFDEFAASDPTIANEFADVATRLGVAAPRVSYYAPRITSLLENARVAADGAQKKGPICYVPAFLLGDSRYGNACNFDGAWYHRWHRLLLDLMESRPDLRFMWKGLPASDQEADPIPAIIADRKLSNVVYETRPFTEVIGAVERVFTDHPSTAMYEAAHLRMPILGLIFRRLCVIRPAAAARFSRVLRECDTEDEALMSIRDFVDAAPERWTVPEGSLAIP